MQGLHVKQDGEEDTAEKRLPLEIDVLAARRQAIATHGVFSVEVLVECKMAPEPWIAFSPLGGAKSGLASSGSAKPIESSTVSAARWLAKSRLRWEIPTLWPNDELAFGLTAMRTRKDPNDKQGKDNAYEALVGVVSRCRLRQESTEATSWHAIHMPVIVVGGDLCMAHWDPTTKNLEVRAIDSCIVEFRGDKVLQTAQVQVVAASGLRRWLKTFGKHVELHIETLFQTVSDVERALSREMLSDLGFNNNNKTDLRFARMLGEVLAARQSARPMTPFDRLRALAKD